MVGKKNPSSKKEGYQPVSLCHSLALHPGPSLPFPRPQIPRMKIMGLMYPGNQHHLVCDTQISIQATSCQRSDEQLKLNPGINGAHAT